MGGARATPSHFILCPDNPGVVGIPALPRFICINLFPTEHFAVRVIDAFSGGTVGIEVTSPEGNEIARVDE